MALKVKDLGASVEKYADRAVGAADIFATEAEAAADAWARNAAAADGNFHAAITAPNVQARFKRGVQRAGSAKFARKIRDVAKDRYGPGITAGKEDYKTDVEPYFTIIAGLTLSPRKPRGDAANYTRVSEVGKALNAKRLALLAVAP